MDPAAKVIQPITIPEALDNVSSMIREILRKNRTMIDYHVHPNPVPDELEQFKPRLMILYARIAALQQIDVAKLTILLDDAQWLMAAYILPVIDQLINGMYGIQELFINHYDRNLAHNKPYQTLHDAFLYREDQLKKLQADVTQPAVRRPAEHFSPPKPPQDDHTGMFCRGAIAMANRRDAGKFSQVMSEDLTAEERRAVKDGGGAYLHWDCTSCAFKVKYHITSANNSTLPACEDLRSHVDAPGVQYRVIWLVKCHLYQHKEDTATKSYNQAEPALTRTTSRVVNKRGRNSVWLGPDQTRSRRATVAWAGNDASLTRPRTGEEIWSMSAKRALKYGCPFCFAVGEDHKGMKFNSAVGLTRHIADEHGEQERRPSPLLLEKYCVAVDGKHSEKVPRWDLNIKSL